MILGSRSTAEAARSEHSGKDLAEDRPQCRETGGENGRADFEERPICGLDVVPVRINAAGRFLQGTDPENRSNARATICVSSSLRKIGAVYLQESKTENNNQGILLPPRQLQRSDDWQRDRDKDNVGDKVEAGHDIPGNQRIETSTLDRGVPECRDGDANQGQQEALHDRPCADKGHAVGCYLPHDSAGEDASVL